MGLFVLCPGGKVLSPPCLHPATAQRPASIPRPTLCNHMMNSCAPEPKLFFSFLFLWGGAGRGKGPLFIRCSPESHLTSASEPLSHPGAKPSFIPDRGPSPMWKRQIGVMWLRANGKQPWEAGSGEGDLYLETLGRVDAGPGNAVIFT